MASVRPTDPTNDLDPRGAGHRRSEERRVSGLRKRRKDRLMDRASRSYPTPESLAKVGDVHNMLLFLDDDLRETALAMSRIESYLVETLELLEAPRLTRARVHALATDKRVLDHVDSLNETLESLRARLSRLAGRLR